jgi:hypothetical protein
MKQSLDAVAAGKEGSSQAKRDEQNKTRELFL